MTVTPADRGPQLAGVIGLFTALSTVAVAMRCYCRMVTVKNFGMDDWFALVAWVLLLLIIVFFKICPNIYYRSCLSSTPGLLSPVYIMEPDNMLLTFHPLRFPLL